MNIHSPTHVFTIDDTDYHCRMLNGIYQSSAEFVESLSPRYRKQARIYWASTCGNVLSTLGEDFSSPRVLKSYAKSADEPRPKVELRVDGKKTKAYVSRLIALTFLDGYGSSDAEGNPRKECNHINQDFTDNRVCNLEWTSQAENAHHYNYWVSEWEAERQGGAL